MQLGVFGIVPVLSVVVLFAGGFAANLMLMRVLIKLVFKIGGDAVVVVFIVLWWFSALVVFSSRLKLFGSAAVVFVSGGGDFPVREGGAVHGSVERVNTSWFRCWVPVWPRGADGGARRVREAMHVLNNIYTQLSISQVAAARW